MRAKTLADIRAGDFAMASAEMLLSDWARDPPEGVGARAARLAAMMKAGARPAPAPTPAAPASAAAQLEDKP